MQISTSLAAEIAGGDQLTLSEIARQMRLNPSTALRWILRGLPDGRGGRVRLEGIRRGKKWLTSRAALARFLAALPQSTTTEAAPPPIRTSSQRSRDAARATAALRDDFGI